MSDLVMKKLVIIGDGACGKTCLLHRFKEDKFQHGYVPTIFGNSEKEMEHPEKPGEMFKMQLWDTAGQEDYETTRTLCYPGTNVLLVAFNVVFPDSFANIKKVWIPESKREGLKGVPIVLVGTKMDLRKDSKTLEELHERNEEPITQAQALKMAEDIGAVTYVETSALTSEGVGKVFHEAATAAFRSQNVEPAGAGCCVLC